MEVTMQVDLAQMIEIVIILIMTQKKEPPRT
jgi:hypothetical protein